MCTVSLHKQRLVSIQIYFIVIFQMDPYQTAQKTGYFRQASGA